jgi:hypothetical protein
VTARMQRWEALYDTSKQWELLMDESVLRRWPGPDGAAVMRTQLDRIEWVVGARNVRLGVIPLERSLSVWPQNAFAVYDHLVLVETFAGENTYPPDTKGAAEYQRWLDRLWTEAVEDPDDLTAIIARAREALTR